MHLENLIARVNDFLNIHQINDYCPNGLQVQSHDQEVRKIALAVTASLEAIEQAKNIGANVLIAHHGWFWKNEPAQLTGMRYQRIRSLLEYDIALMAYHLPLDIHPVVGNNIQLAKVLDLVLTDYIKPDGKLPLLVLGHLKTLQSLSDFARLCQDKLGRLPLSVAGGDHPVYKIAWCTGAAQDFIEEAKRYGADLYLSGEISERTYYQAKELGIHYLACGHHATERYGIQALGAWLQENFGLPTQFIDADNPV